MRIAAVFSLCFLLQVPAAQLTVRLSGTVAAPLPAPALADGLSAAQHAKVIEDLPGRQTPVEELTRLSTVAPFVLKIRDIDSGDREAPGRSVDLFFIAQGKLDDLAKTDFLDRLLNSGRKDAAIQPLDEKANGQTAYAHISVPLMDRVLLRGTCKTWWTRTEEAITVWGRLDPAFNADARFPNQWRKLRRDDDGKPQPEGPAHGYDAAGYMLKITKLKEPAGALFVEWHLVYSEPTAWFDGANLLRSKLPLVLQTKVRGFRRELLK